MVGARVLVAPSEEQRPLGLGQKAQVARLHALDADAAETFGDAIDVPTTALDVVTSWLSHQARAEHALPSLSLTGEDLASILYTWAPLGIRRG